MYSPMLRILPRLMAAERLADAAGQPPLYWEGWMRPAIFAAIVVLLILLRRPLAKLLLRQFGRRLKRRPQVQPERRARLSSAVGWTLAMLVLRMLLPFSGIAGEAYPLLTRLSNTLLQIPLFVSLYLLAAALLSRPRKDDSGHLDANARNYLDIGLRTLILVIGFFAVISNWVTNLGGLITGLGIGGLLLALAAQETASNIVAGVALMLDQPFRIGDWIETGSGSGTVAKVGLRSTRIRQIDQSILTIPNAKLGGDAIVNGSLRRARRVSFLLELPHDTAVATLRRLSAQTRELLEAHGDVLDEGQLVAIEDLTNTAIRLRVTFQTPSDFNEMVRVREDITLGLIERMRALGLTTALPTLALRSQAGDAANGAEAGALQRSACAADGVEAVTDEEDGI